MKKKLLPVLALAISALALFGQNNTQDVIYLKSGSVIKGSLLSLQEQIIKVELLGGSIFVFQRSEVDSIKKENVVKTGLTEINKNYYRRERGYRNITEVGILYGPGSGNSAPTYYSSYSSSDDFGMSLHTINGYQFWPYLYAGAGIGIDRFITYKETFSPFYIRLASEFLKKRVTPYVFIDAGYSVMWKQANNTEYTYHTQGGLYLSAGAGIRIYTRSRASVLIGLAYKRNVSEVNYSYTYDPGTLYTDKRIYQRMVFNVGVSF